MSERDEDAACREQAEALIADLRARVSHYEALVVAVREETITKAALAVDYLMIRFGTAFNEPWDRGYRQGIKDSAYAVRELRITPPSPTDETGVGQMMDKKHGARWCRLFGHRWEQDLIDGWWRFRCRRCAHVEGYCGQAEPTDLACCRIAVNCLTEHDPTPPTSTTETGAAREAELTAAVRALTVRVNTAEPALEAALVALEAGDACGAVGCRALAERDALLEREARVVELAEWFDAQVNWREWGIGNQIRRALDGDQP